MRPACQLSAAVARGASSTVSPIDRDRRLASRRSWGTGLSGSEVQLRYPGKPLTYLSPQVLRTSRSVPCQGNGDETPRLLNSAAPGSPPGAPQTAGATCRRQRRGRFTCLLKATRRPNSKRRCHRTHNGVLRESVFHRTGEPVRDVRKTWTVAARCSPPAIATSRGLTPANCYHLLNADIRGRGRQRAGQLPPR